MFHTSCVVISREHGPGPDDDYIIDERDPEWELEHIRHDAAGAAHWFDDVMDSGVYHQRRRCLIEHCWKVFRTHPEFAANL